MVKKCFCIMSNSEKHLTADTIAMALMKHISSNNHKKAGIVFGVMEAGQGADFQEIMDEAMSMKA